MPTHGGGGQDELTWVAGYILNGKTFHRRLLTETKPQNLTQAASLDNSASAHAPDKEKV